MSRIIDETIGWLGISLILIAYALNMFGILSPENIIYLVMNILGSLGVVYISLKKKTYQPGVLNIIWAIIALIALIGVLI